MATLEEELKQKRFENEFEKAAVNILFTASWLYNINTARFKKHGLTGEQYNVLRILRGSYPKPLMLADITCRMVDRSSNATRLVEKLRQKGLLQRELCPGNRRQVEILITEPGLSLLSAIDKERDEWIKQLRGITKAEAQELNRLLDKLRS